MAIVWSTSRVVVWMLALAGCGSVAHSAPAPDRAASPQPEPPVLQPVTPPALQPGTPPCEDPRAGLATLPADHRRSSPAARADWLAAERFERRRDRPDPEAIYAVEIDGAPARGGDEAWVTLVVVGDFTCVRCARMQPLIAALLTAYGADLKVVFKAYPMPHEPDALPAAVAAACAHAQGAFWALYDRLMVRKPRLGLADLERGATEAGLDVRRWRRCAGDPATAARVESERRSLAELGVQSPPAYFVNGRYLGGVQPVAVLKAAIDEALQRARTSGVAPRDYYARVVLGSGRRVP